MSTSPIPLITQVADLVGCCLGVEIPYGKSRRNGTEHHKHGRKMRNVTYLKVLKHSGVKVDKMNNSFQRNEGK